MVQRSGIDTIKYHTWPRIPMGKWQTHRRHHKREPRGQPFPSRWPQSTYKQTCTKHSKHKTEQKHKRSTKEVTYRDFRIIFMFCSDMRCCSFLTYLPHRSHIGISGSYLCFVLIWDAVLLWHIYLIEVTYRDFRIIFMFCFDMRCCSFVTYLPHRSHI